MAGVSFCQDYLESRCDSVPRKTILLDLEVALVQLRPTMRIAQNSDEGASPRIRSKYAEAALLSARGSNLTSTLDWVASGEPARTPIATSLPPFISEPGEDGEL